MTSIAEKKSLFERLFVDGPQTFSAFLETEVAGAVALLGATVIALLLANSPVADEFARLFHIEVGLFAGGMEFSQSIVHWIDDGLMALFFFVVGLEIKREILVGELSDMRKAVLPVLAAVGGMVVPALIYLSFNAGGEGARGWGVPMATDIAFALGIMALLGSRVPSGLRVFLVALAIADDIGAILVIAIFYTSQVHFAWLGAAAVVFAILFAIGRSGVDSPWPYGILGGVMWFAMLMSGVHATISGVLVALTIPAVAQLDPLTFTCTTRERLRAIDERNVPGAHVLEDPRQQMVAHQIALDCKHIAAPLQRLEFALHPWTTFVVLPLFALGNAGVSLAGVHLGGLLAQPIALGVIAGLVIGKPVGIMLMAWVAVKARLAELPAGVRWGHVAGAGLLGGVGFTMSIFVANLAFTDPAHVAEAKVAVLIASLVAGMAGYLALRAIGSGRTAPGA